MPTISQELASTRTARWYLAQDGQPTARWAVGRASVQPGGALVAEAKVTAFWPYREGVIKIADAFDMAPVEWAAAYLRALAAWTGDNRMLAVCDPADPPGCVPEDMKVLAARRRCRVGEPAVRFRAARLAELACTVIGLVLDDVSITPLGAFNAVRDEVQQLLTGPSVSLADLVISSMAELSDRIHQGDSEAVLTAGQTGQILGLLNGLGSLLTDLGAS